MSIRFIAMAALLGLAGCDVSTDYDPYVAAVENQLQTRSHQTRQIEGTDYDRLVTAVIGTLLIAGSTSDGADPMEALRNAMIIGALPFTMVMGLMCIALAKALYRDGLRDNSGAAAANPAE